MGSVVVFAPYLAESLHAYASLGRSIAFDFALRRRSDCFGALRQVFDFDHFCPFEDSVDFFRVRWCPYGLYCLIEVAESFLRLWDVHLFGR